jgi:hypothetical protein
MKNSDSDAFLLDLIVLMPQLRQHLRNWFPSRSSSFQAYGVRQRALPVTTACHQKRRAKGETCAKLCSDLLEFALLIRLANCVRFVGIRVRDWLAILRLTGWQFRNDWLSIAGKLG